MMVYNSEKIQEYCFPSHKGTLQNVGFSQSTIPKSKEYGSLDRYSLETLFHATLAALLEDFWLKPYAYQL